MPNRGEPEGPLGESVLNLEASMPQAGELEGAPRQSAVNGKPPTYQSAVDVEAPQAKAR